MQTVFNRFPQELELEQNPTQSRSFHSQSSQPITWLILKNKTAQDNMQTKHNSEKPHNAKYKNYPGSVASWGLIIAPDATQLNSTQLSWVELDRALWSLLRPDSTQLNWLASCCQFWTFQLSWVELSPVVGVIIAPDPTRLDEADWLSVVTQFSIPMSLFHC